MVYTVHVRYLGFNHFLVPKLCRSHFVPCFHVSGLRGQVPGWRFVPGLSEAWALAEIDRRVSSSAKASRPCDHPRDDLSLLLW